MIPGVDLILDKPRRFRLTPTDWRAAARMASLLMSMPIATNRLLILVGEEDLTALACTLWAGTRHEDGKVTTDKILDALDERLVAAQDRGPREGSPFEDLGEAILSELRRIGVLRRPKPEEESDPNARTPSISGTPSSG